MLYIVSSLLSVYVIYSRITIQAKAIKEDIGYPSYIKDDSQLDAQYSMVSNYCFVCIGNHTVSSSIWNRRSGSCNFSFLKNSLVQINFKLNEKNRMITY